MTRDYSPWAQPIDRLEHERRAVSTALWCEGPTNTDYLVALTGLTPFEVVSALMDLREAGKVVRFGDEFNYLRVRPRWRPIDG